MNTLLKGIVNDMDNAKVLMLGCVLVLVLANVGLILHLMLVDGASTQSTLNFLEQEVTLLIPTSGIVSVIQHGVTSYFNAKKPPAPPPTQAASNSQS